MIYITLIFEDDLSEAVMIKILSHFSDKYEVCQSYRGNGFGYLKSNIQGFNQASKVNPHFMLTDLDNYNCPVTLREDWINFEMSPNFIFRIAIREVESWVLADREGLSQYFNVSVVNFPINPDLENDPKNTLIQLAKRSKKRDIREDIVPINQNAKIGPNYNGCLSDFVFRSWNIENAVNHSASLKKTFEKLRDFNP
ncbi:MAG: hypothetical protein JXR34_08985 [Bacteroidales bacterium]|nr:hypothetical protein [Bacteroidales bacterium]